MAGDLNKILDYGDETVLDYEAMDEEEEDPQETVKVVY